jgi:hypothetical protein
MIINKDYVQLITEGVFNMAGQIRNKTFTLNTGAKIPAIGFGTWKAGPGEAANAVKTAFEAGYRHFVWIPLSHLSQLLRR